MVRTYMKTNTEVVCVVFFVFFFSGRELFNVVSCDGYFVLKHCRVTEKKIEFRFRSTGGDTIFGLRKRRHSLCFVFSGIESLSIVYTVLESDII